MFEPYAHTETDDRGEGAVGYCGGYEDGYCCDGGGGGGASVWEGGSEGDVGEVDDGKGAEGEGVFGVLDGGYEVCVVMEKVSLKRSC